MALDKWDEFKAGFGQYNATRVGDWRAAAEAALLKLTGAVTALKEVEDDDDLRDPHEKKLDTLEKARKVAHGKESSQAKVACAEYKAIIDAAKLATGSAQAAVIAAKPGKTRLESVMKKSSGPEILDQLVASIGSKANSKDKRDFMESAIKARFDITSLTGALSSKALPRMYELLRRLPTDHTTNNSKLAHIDRHKKEGFSSYNQSKIVLNASTAGNRGKTVKYSTDTGDHKVKVFDAHTLHEVGHAVDDNDGMMKKAPDDAKFGKWKEESSADLLSVAGTDLGFDKDFSALSSAMRKMLLAGFLDGSVPKPDALSGVLNALVDAGVQGIAKDPGFQHAVQLRLDQKGEPVWTIQCKDECYEKIAFKDKDTIKVPLMEAITKILQDIPEPKAMEAIKDVFDPLLNTSIDWDELAKHKAGAWLQAIGASPSGNWMLGESTIKDAAIKKRVFQQSYPNVYWSYDIDARKHMVRPYQFRAAGEWFAEVYAMYFLGLLGTGHPAYSWLQKAYGDPPSKM